MISLTINPTQIARNAKYVRNNHDHYDLSGLIAMALYQQQKSKGLFIPAGTRTLAELPNAIYPLTTFIRQRVVLTPIGYHLLTLSPQETHDQLVGANAILRPVGIEVKTEALNYQA